MNRPFIYKFRTVNGRYIYDVNSNHILEVDPVVHDVISLWGTMPNDKISETLCHKFTQEEIRRAMAEIVSFSKAGFFKYFRPTALRYHKPFAAMRRDLKTRLEQVVLGVTETCNLRCGYCSYSGRYLYKRSHSPKNMSWSIARKAVDYLLSHSQDRKKISVGFYGGEPLLRFDLIQKTVQYIKKTSGEKHVRFNFTTNGTLITDAIIDFLAENEIRVLISLDGPKDVNDRYRLFRNGQGSYDKIIKNLERILTRYESYYRRQVSFNMVIAPPFKPLEIESFIRNNEHLFKNAQIRIGGIDAQGTTFFNKFPPKDRTRREFKILEKRFLEEVAHGCEANTRLLRIMMRENILLKIYKRDVGRQMTNYEYPNGVCTPGLRRIFVSVDGMFHMCEKINENMAIGNVGTGLDLDRIISMMKNYAEKSSPDCCDCWALRLCSLCYIHASRANFDMEAKRRNCETTRKTILHGLKLYCKILEKNPDALAAMKNIVLS
jgi:uncharacterized protein